jgi:hypothetical protein
MGDEYEAGKVLGARLITEILETHSDHAAEAWLISERFKRSSSGSPSRIDEGFFDGAKAVLDARRP